MEVLFSQWRQGEQGLRFAEHRSKKRKQFLQTVAEQSSETMESSPLDLLFGGGAGGASQKKGGRNTLTRTPTLILTPTLGATRVLHGALGLARKPKGLKSGPLFWRVSVSIFSLRSI